MWTETQRKPIVADKLSNQHAGKGVVAYQRENYDMLIEERTNTRVDLILCIEGFPSRRIAGLLREIQAAKATALSGEVFDDDHEYDEVLRQAQLKRVQEILGDAGWDPQGTEIFIDPMTGDRVPQPLMTGILSIQRLTHLVNRKCHARSTGPLNHFSRQPVTGRKKGGGQKNGYMELNAAANHGMASYLWNRNVLQSDPNEFFAFCQACGTRVVYNPHIQHGWCIKCQTDAHIQARIAPFSLSLLQYFLASTGIKMNFQQQQRLVTAPSVGGTTNEHPI